MHFVSRFRWVALALAVLVAGCSNIQLVDRYDVAIENGINKYHVDVVKFLKEDVSYTSDEAKAFYAGAAADLANVIVRAQVVAINNSCVEPKFIDGIVGVLRSGSAFAGQAATSIGTADISLKDGSCTVVALKALAANHARIEAIHKRNNKLGPFRSALAADMISDSVRIALTIEAAKKP